MVINVHVLISNIFGCIKLKITSVQTSIDNPSVVNKGVTTVNYVFITSAFHTFG